MAAEVLKLTPSEVYEFVTTALACRQVPYVAGPPAIGKSQVIAQVAFDANALMIDMRLSQKLSEDLTGLPERDPLRGKAIYLPFDDIPLEGDPLPGQTFDAEGNELTPPTHSGWLLFLDELSSASEEVLAASYSLILDRTVGGKKLHPKCLVVAAGNRASDSAIARELPDTLITRMLPIEMKINHKDWIRWANGHTKSNEAVVDFLEKNPSMLYAPTKAKDRQELETYPTPRGWEKVFAHVNFHEKQVAASGKKERPVDAAGIPVGEETVPSEPLTEVVFNLICAAVGAMAARSFRDEYDEAIKLPYPWEVAQSPSSQRIPSNHVGKAKLTVDLAKHFLQSNSDVRDNLMTYMNRIGGEYSELFLKEIKSKLGTTSSDIRLTEEIGKRLNIDPILGSAPKADPNAPF